MSQQYANSALTPAKLLAVNVNGLARDDKRKAFLQFVMDSAWDVLVLSETHCGELGVAHKWLKEGAGPGKPWLGEHFWALGTSASRGVAILLRHGFAPEAKLEFVDNTDGRLLRVGWERGPGLRPASVLAVYAPSDSVASRSTFFANGGPLHSALCAGTGTSADLFVGGDFNCKLPGPGVAPPGDLAGDAQLLHSLMSSAGLVDVWAAVWAASSQPHQPEDAWTFISHSAGNCGRRLDYWFAPHALVTAGWASRCAHRWDAASPSDHAAVDLSWACPVARPRGTGRWRFPAFLLRDHAFVPTATEKLKLFIEQWQPRSPADQASPARARWDDVKRCIKHLALQHLHARSQQRLSVLRQASAAERLARARAVQASPATAHEAFQQWQVAARHLAAVSVRPGTGTAEQSLPLDVHWEACGEQSTKWFYQLMPREPEDPALAGGITAVSVPGTDGSPVLRSVHDAGGVAAVGDALSAYFDGSAGGLFAPGDVNVDDQDLLLAAVDRTVPAAEAELCKGPAADGTVSAACLRQALLGTEGGKAPGSDGLPYEVYRVFWEVLGEPLAECFNEAFADAAAGGALLSASQRKGIITLLHKGGGKPVDQVTSYRPITLLNTDVKLLARVLVGRMGPALECVIDQSQTAFLPGRWIGDNVLFHLEEVDYCQAEGVPGSVLFLDFEKAYDRVDRGWLFRCVDRLGFPPEVGRWVRLLLQGSVAGVLYHGFLSPWVPVLCSVAQGSPASPVLYLIAAQPLAARLRQLQAAGLVDAVVLPDGSAAPPSHQHADDTTLHTRTPHGAREALRLAVEPFCRASNARLNVSKSLGLLLGPTHDLPEARAAAQAVTGVPFVPPGQHLRHLGVLLSVGDPEGACKAMFAKRRSGVQFRVRSWARFDLSYLGRLHVAKQVLASSLFFHAQFVPPPEDVLEGIVACVDQFVGFGRLVEPGEAGGVLRAFPSAAVESLPFELGGLRRVDIPAQVMALHGKVAAMLLHPRRHPWKVLLRRAFERAVAALGPAVLVSQLRPVAVHGRSVRLLAYWKALHALAPCRLVQPALLPARHVLAERLVRNAQVVGPSLSRPVVDAAGCLPAAVREAPGFQPTLGGLRGVLLAGPDGPGFAAARGVAGQVAPPEWRAILSSPEPLPQSLWLVSACGAWLVCSEVDRNPPGVFAVRPDGRVGPAPVGGLPAGIVEPVLAAVGFWRAACVVWCPVLKGQELLVALRPDPHLQGLEAFAVEGASQRCALQPWVMGEWGRGVWADPNVWGLGSRPLSDFVVKAAARRLLLLGMCRHDPGFHPVEGVRPKLFAVPGRPGSGLGPLVARQERVFAERWTALAAGQGGSQRRVRARLPEDEQGRCPLYEAAWMRASLARVHPLERALLRQGAVVVGGGQARQDDCRDALLGYAVDRPRAWPSPQPTGGQRPPAAPPWRQVFSDLRRLKRLDRRLRFFGWSLAHGALRCGGALVEWWAPGPLDEAADAAGAFVEMCGCSAEGCAHGQQPPGAAPPCETLAHVLVCCPVVRPAVRWLCRLCERALGGAPPEDIIVDVIVTGARSLWSPPGAGADRWALWTHLRLQFCYTVWTLTSRRNRAGQQFDAAAIVAMTAAALERAIRLDWVRVGVASGGGGDLPSWCSLGLRRVRLQPEVFAGRWLAGGVLAHLAVGGGRDALCVHVPRALEQPVSGS